MDSTLSELLEEYGLRDRNIVSAHEQSERHIADARSDLQDKLGADHKEFDVLLFGSVARREATSGSDLDYLVVLHRLPKDVTLTRKVMAAVEETRAKLSLKEPGSTKIFGVAASVTDMVEKIGLEQDTNLNHTRRILLLQESVSAYREDLHRYLMERVLERYLIDYEQAKKGVPRFLLNDVMRYWRTLAVDYQAKRWQGKQDWGLRYLKLLISRKLAYAGTLASILLTEEATPEYFLEQFGLPPLARFARLKGHVPEADLKLCFEIADEFIGRLADSDFRDKAAAVESPNSFAEHPEVQEMREKAKKLQHGLQSVFFSKDSAIRDQALKYMNF